MSHFIYLRNMSLVLLGSTTNIYLPGGELVEDLGLGDLHMEINRLKSELREKEQKVKDVDRLARYVCVLCFI